MDVEHIPILINAGIGAVLLFLYMRQAEQVAKLQTELHEVREAQWALIISLVGEEVAHEISNRPEKK